MKPNKQVQFKTPTATSSSDDTELIQLTQKMTSKPTYVKLYDSSDTNSVDIPNMQACKYSPQKQSTDDMNNEGMPTKDYTPSPIQKMDE